MHSKSDNIEIMINDEADEVMKANKCFQYAVTVALNHEEFKKRSAPFLTKYNWKGKDFPSEKQDFNVLYVKEEKNISCLRFKM